MLQYVRLIQEIGQFEQVSSAAQIELSPLSLIYAENGRGKTTLVSVFRSLQSGDPAPITERRRLSATRESQVALSFTDEAAAVVFQNAAWTSQKANIAIFDEQFVTDNVYSGLVVQSSQRQALHELIVGAQGVALLKTLQDEVAKIELHNQQIRQLGAAIPRRALRGLEVDEFCSLPVIDGISEKIDESKKAVAAAEQQTSITKMTGFSEIEVPIVPEEAVANLLGERLQTLASAAERKVRSHLAKLGPEGEAWAAQGLHLQQDHYDTLQDACPFCAQALNASSIFGLYQDYFSTSYNELKSKVERWVQRLEAISGASALDKVKRDFVANETKQLFWREFLEVELPVLELDRVLTFADRAYQLLMAQLKMKLENPLEPIELSIETMAAIRQLVTEHEAINGYNEAAKSFNQRIEAVKEAAKNANAETLKNDLARLEAARDRRDPKIDTQCSTYLDEKGAKQATELRRDAARAALDAYRQNIFPAFQEAINIYLRRLNANFRIDQIQSQQSRAGATCVYNVVIDNQPGHPIPVTAATTGEPSFKTVLSTGDRNTLALAVFLASINQDPQKADKIVIIDDPINSLDEHRALATVTEIRRLVTEVSQVIVLSHNRPIVCHLWESPGQVGRTAVEVARSVNGSTLREWDVSSHGVTEHDKRHAKLREYLIAQPPNSREVAEAIRPTLEAFLRVAYPEACPPGTLLGRFREICRQRVGTATEILSQADITELQELADYGNRFHHDTNPAWQAENINDAELLNFVRRTINFTKRA